jgi:DNA-binding NtrC family response regulator
MLLKKANILIVDDDPDVLNALRLLLKPMVKSVTIEKNPNNISNILSHQPIDLVVLDMNFSGAVHTGNEGIFWLNQIKKINDDIAVVLMTA